VSCHLTRTAPWWPCRCWSATAYSSGRNPLISQLTSISRGRSPIRRLGTRWMAVQLCTPRTAYLNFCDDLCFNTLALSSGPMALASKVQTLALASRVEVLVLVLRFWPRLRQWYYVHVLQYFLDSEFSSRVIISLLFFTCKIFDQTNPYFNSMYLAFCSCQSPHVSQPCVKIGCNIVLDTTSKLSRYK